MQNGQNRKNAKTTKAETPVLSKQIPFSFVLRARWKACRMQTFKNSKLQRKYTSHVMYHQKHVAYVEALVMSCTWKMCTTRPMLDCFLWLKLFTAANFPVTMNSLALYADHAKGNWTTLNRSRRWRAAVKLPYSAQKDALIFRPLLQPVRQKVAK